MSWIKKRFSKEFKDNWLWASGGNKCEVCGLEIKRVAPGQVARFHGECREARHEHK